MISSYESSFSYFFPIVKKEIIISGLLSGKKDRMCMVLKNDLWPLCTEYLRGDVEQ